MNFSEQQLINWSKPVSTSEDQICKNAISEITSALRAKFGDKVTIFLQGSYRNNTNVRQNSDVDIVMRYDDVYYSDFQRLTATDEAIVRSQQIPAQYKFEDLKNDTEAALVAAFGKDVERRNKCIQVNGNTYRITGDVIPCFVLKRYRSVNSIEAEGIKFFTDKWDTVISFPNQHYNNGTTKTQNTFRLYKRMVRVLKVMNNRLIDQKVISDKLASSFFIECLVYNVPDSEFVSGNYNQTLKNVMIKIYKDMEVNANYIEVSGLMWLFKSDYPRTRKDAMDFIQACWIFAGYNQ